MSDFEQRFNQYLDEYVHPDVQAQYRREIALGTSSIQGFFRWVDVFQANHDALDHELEVGSAQVGWTPEGDFVDNYAQVLPFPQRAVDL